MYKLSLNELASEGERLCKSNDCANGIKYFEAAAHVYNTQLKDETNRSEQEQLRLLQTMSIIYNQMGNAYFYLQDYVKALEYHKKDLDLSEQFGDESGKAKACGNIGNTLQLLGDFDEAILYSMRNLDISRQLNDLTGEARALYNLANIYQSKGKHMGRLTYNDGRDPNNSEFANEIKEVLMKAVYYYQETLKLVASKDRAAEGRTYGNLGNTYYLLGDFESAIECHNQRLKIAKEYGDRPAERRAYSNLGNAHIFQGKFNEASEYYLKAMNVARMLGDKAIEAQSYYSLGNVYILLQDYSVAIDFHLRHLQIAQLLDDKIGESRAYWSLGNAYAALGDLENAIVYANKHLQLARILGDTTSELTAKMNLYDFQNLLSNSGIRDFETGLFTPSSSTKHGRKYFDRRSSIRKSLSIDSFYNNTAIERPQPVPPLQTQPIQQEQQLKQSQPQLQQLQQQQQSQPKQMQQQETEQTQKQLRNTSTSYRLKSSDSKQDRLADLKKTTQISLSARDIVATTKTESVDLKDDDISLLDAIYRIQSNRLNDQRCSIKRLSDKKSNKSSQSSLNKDDNNNKQTTPIENDETNDDNNNNNNNNPTSTTTTTTTTTNNNNNDQSSRNGSMTMNDEFFNLILKSQRTRLEDQRSSMNVTKLKCNSLSSKSAVSSSTESSTSSGGSSTNDTLNNKSNPNNANTTSNNNSNNKNKPPLSTNNSSNSNNINTKIETSNAITVPPDDEFFSMILKIQSRRLNEQRSEIKPTPPF